VLNQQQITSLPEPARQFGGFELLIDVDVFIASRRQRAGHVPW